MGGRVKLDYANSRLNMLFALPAVWLICAVAGYLYSQQQGIPAWMFRAAIGAILLEITFYYMLGVESLRTRLERLSPAMVGVVLTLAAITPYVALTLGFHSFRWASLGWLTLLAGLASFWFIVLPKRPLFDLLFLAMAAAVMLAKVFHPIYGDDPHPKLPLAALGQLMWFRTCILAMLSVRRMKGVGFGFWPKATEWRIGAIFYVLFLPAAAVLAWAIGFARPHLPTAGWQKTSVVALATFFGILWVVALGEEFFFRGLLQQWFSAWTRSETVGLIAASVAFGSVHLWFRNFPNWRFALLAAVAGVFYGLAFRRARSIRASMVTHALVVTTWRVFF